MSQANNPGIKEVLNQVRIMGENLAGFVVGNMAINMANKVLKIDPNDPAQPGLKKALPPLVVTGGALFGCTQVEQPSLQNVLKGAAMAGAYKTARALMPKASFLAGADMNGLGLSPVSAVSNPDRWLYHEHTPVSGVGFPDLGEIQPPDGASGYYLDAPAYMGDPLPEAFYQPESEEIILSSPVAGPVSGEADNYTEYILPGEALSDDVLSGEDDYEIL